MAEWAERTAAKQAKALRLAEARRLRRRLRSRARSARRAADRRAREAAVVAKREAPVLAPFTGRIRPDLRRGAQLLNAEWIPPHVFEAFGGYA